MSPHNTHPSERLQPFQGHSSSSRLCVRQIENEQQSTVGEVSQLRNRAAGGLALAGRLAGQDNAVPSLPGSDSWLSEKKQKKSRSSFLSSNIARLGGVESSYILDVVTDVVATFCLDLDRQQTCVDHCCMSGSSRAVDCVTCATRLLTITVRDKPAT